MTLARAVRVKINMTGLGAIIINQRTAMWSVVYILGRQRLIR